MVCAKAAGRVMTEAYPCGTSQGDTRPRTPTDAIFSSRFRFPPRLVKTASNEAAGKPEPEAYPQGYVEDCGEPRTKLEVVFTSRLDRTGEGLIRRP